MTEHISPYPVDPFESDRPNANAGLLFQRCFNQYTPNWGMKDANKDAAARKTIFLESIVTNAPLVDGKHKHGSAEQLDKYLEKQKKLIEQLKGISHNYRCEWNWVTGLGYSHPVENGLTWHHSLGIPYIPGSSIKGLVRAWLETQDEVDKAQLLLWFGSDAKDPKEREDRVQSGGVIFFDAISIEPIQLKVDVMTPHTGNWLSEGGKDNAPGDWIDPVPIPFLSCVNGTLNFSIALAPHACEKVDIKAVAEALQSALDFLGVGAKTSNGYGLFLPVESTPN